MKAIIKRLLNNLGYDLTKVSPAGGSGADRELYAPLYSPWLGSGPFEKLFDRVKPHTLVSVDRCYVLYTLARQAVSLEGDFWECGVYQGGTAVLLAEVVATTQPARTRLHLFDTFQGMPGTDPKKDLHKRGDFADTSLRAVRERVGREDVVSFHEGLVPDSFAGFEESHIAFAHIDVDIWQSVTDCCEFIVPRLVHGGFMVFDDYGFPTCPGAREAVDGFFRERLEKPLALPTGQAIVFNSFKPAGMKSHSAQPDAAADADKLRR